MTAYKGLLTMIDNDNNPETIPDSKQNRQTSTMLSLPNVLWILVTVVSVASFLFTYDSRISVLEQQSKGIPELEDEIAELEDDVITLKSDLRQLKSTAPHTDDVTELRQRVRGLEFAVESLRNDVKRLRKQKNAASEN